MLIYIGFSCLEKMEKTFFINKTSSSILISKSRPGSLQKDAKMSFLTA